MTTKEDSKPTALIVEDDQDLVNIFARALELSGYETQTAEDGDSALLRLAEMTPQVVLLDLHLPGMFGRDILRAIRNDGRLSQTKVIVATADYHSAEELRDEADLVLLKPIGFKQLRDLSGRLSQMQTPSDPTTN